MTETRAPVERTYRPRLAGLDAVRVFAAVSVMVFHLGFWSWAAPSTAGTIVQGAVAYPALVPFAFWGRFGVETFFVVSGFVIAFTAANMLPPQVLAAPLFSIFRLIPLPYWISDSGSLLNTYFAVVIVDVAFSSDSARSCSATT